MSTLHQEIQNEFSRLKRRVASIPFTLRTSKILDGTGGKVSVADLIAYQIGWGRCLIQWYEAGIKGEKPLMPCEGFSKWNYKRIAKHFYEKYPYDSFLTQESEFELTVLQILNIVEKESALGRLEQIGVWQWCTLKSGKEWPLSKWVRINTASPYKRANLIIEKLN